MSHQVFISYSRDDSPFVRRLAEDLKRYGVNAWMDVLEIQPGERWDSEVQGALRECEYFMVVISPTSSSSENVQDEIAYALSKKKHVYPILYQDADIPYRLARVQYVDFRKDYSAGLERLLDQMRLTGLLKAGAGGAATAPDVEPQAVQPASGAPELPKAPLAPQKALAQPSVTDWKGKLRSIPIWGWGAGGLVVLAVLLALIFASNPAAPAAPTPLATTEQAITDTQAVVAAITDAPVISPPATSPAAPPTEPSVQDTLTPEPTEATLITETIAPDPYLSHGDCVQFAPPCSYTVVSLDSFSKIASKMYGLEELTPLVMNGNRDPAGYRILLKPGQVIFIPHPETSIAELMEHRLPKCGPNVFPCWYEIHGEQSYDDLARIFYANPSASKQIQSANWAYDASKQVKLITPEIIPGLRVVLPIVED